MKAYAAILGVSTVLPLLASRGALFTSLQWPLYVFPRPTAEQTYRLGIGATLGFAGLVAYLANNPQSISCMWLTPPLGALGTLAVRLLACGALLGTAVLYNLMDAARRRRLGASTFKALNVGVAAVCGVLLALVKVGTEISAGKKLGSIVQIPVMPISIEDAMARWTDVVFLTALGVTILVGTVAVFQALFAQNK